MRQRLTLAEYDAIFSTFLRSAFRLECQPFYVVTWENEHLARFHAGQPLPPTDEDGYAAWLDYVRGQTAAGRRIERVRVHPEPPTAYQRWERWAGTWNVAAGESIGYMTPQAATGVGVPLACDWWLFDDEQLCIMDFDEDGVLVGADLITDHEIVVQHCAWRNLAVRYSAPDSGTHATT